MHRVFRQIPRMSTLFDSFCNLISGKTFFGLAIRFSFSVSLKTFVKLRWPDTMNNSVWLVRRTFLAVCFVARPFSLFWWKLHLRRVWEAGLLDNPDSFSCLKLGIFNSNVGYRSVFFHFFFSYLHFPPAIFLISRFLIILSDSLRVYLVCLHIYPAIS